MTFHVGFQAGQEPHSNPGCINPPPPAAVHTAPTIIPVPCLAKQGPSEGNISDDGEITALIY